MSYVRYFLDIKRHSWKLSLSFSFQEVMPGIPEEENKDIITFSKSSKITISLYCIQDANVPF